MPDASATPANTPVPPGRRLSGLTAAAAAAAASTAGGTGGSRKSGISGSSGSRSSGRRLSTPSGSSSSSSSSRPLSPLTPATPPNVDTAAAPAREMRTSASTETAATTASSDDESTSTSGGTVQRPGGISRKYVSTLVRRRSMSTEVDGMMALAVPTTTGARAAAGKEERIAEVPSSEDVPGVGVLQPIGSGSTRPARDGTHDDVASNPSSSSSAESVYHSFPSLVSDDTAVLAAAILARSGAGTPTQPISTSTTLSLALPPPPPLPPTIPTMTVIPPPLRTATSTSTARTPKSILRTPPGSRDPTSGPPVIARTRDIAKIKAVMFRAQLVDVREISRMSLSSTTASGTASSTHQLDHTAAMLSSLFLDVGGNTSIVVPTPAAVSAHVPVPESVEMPPMPSSFSASDLTDLMLLSDSLGWTPPGSTGRAAGNLGSIPSTPPTLSRNLRKRPPTAPRPRRESPMASTAGLPLPLHGLVGNFDPLDGIPDFGPAMPAPDMLVSPPDDTTGDRADPAAAAPGVTAVTTTTDLLPPPGVLVMPLDPNATTTTLSHSGYLPLIAPDSLWSRLILRVRAAPPPPPPSRSATSSASPPNAGPASPPPQQQQTEAPQRRRAASEVTGRTAVTAFLAKARRNSGGNSGAGGNVSGAVAETVVVMRPAGEQP
ncbi:hypothetical protein GGF32_002862 [Allomyces javanicus]|nr:hypothetical protein GGF32_002862 [Allomyces javanicus]